VTVRAGEKDEPRRFDGGERLETLVKDASALASIKLEEWT